MTKALSVGGWKKAQPVREEKPNKRTLRVRGGKTLRLTTKPGGQKHGKARARKIDLALENGQREVLV